MKMSNFAKDSEVIKRNRKTRNNEQIINTIPYNSNKL